MGNVFFLESSLFTWVFIHTHTHTHIYIADVDKHIFEKYFKPMEKQSRMYFLKNKKSTTERIIIDSMSEDNRQA